MECLLVLVIPVAIAVTVAHVSRARSRVEVWAAREGYSLVSAQRCWMWRGPYWLRSSNSQEVYRVVVRDRDGRTRSGHVRVGGWFAGAWSDATDVTWDDGGGRASGS